jgi:hypothetical protein
MPGNDKKRARWRHNPQHEAIVIKALLGDDSVTATEIRREHLTINDNYDEQQINSKLHNLRPSRGDVGTVGFWSDKEGA